MNISLAQGDPTKAKVDLLVLPVFEQDLAAPKKLPALARADQRTRGLLLKAAAQEGFKGKSEQSFAFHTHAKLAPTRVLLLGLGSKSKYTPEALRLCCGRATKAASRLGAKSMGVLLPAVGDLAAAAKGAAEGLLLGAYCFDKYRSKPREDKTSSVGKTSLFLPDGAKKSRELDAEARLGVRVAEATNWAKDLVNEPAAVMSPEQLAREATAMAKEHGLEVSIHGRKEIARLKMGMFLGVAQGSVTEPQLIHLAYVPREAKAAKQPPLALVGKAITFDSGGLSLKPADAMVDMKVDMAGAAAVLGAMRVIAHLAPPFPVQAFMGACENMPSGHAYRPGDVLVSRLGKTVEITNTDAEGRLVLGDMLAWANETKPAALVDLATLTGACVIALGNHIAGVFGEDDHLVWLWLESARAAGEEAWRMPVAPLQKDALRSEVADMKNSGERPGAALNAANFLREFVGDTPWVHVDIAGPATASKERGYISKGATGYGVRTLVELVRRRSQELKTAEAS